ncbi:MAG: hypothetical protein ACE1ZA_11570, partial [Pseudomonadales bacterium]
ANVSTIVNKVNRTGGSSAGWETCPTSHLLLFQQSLEGAGDARSASLRSGASNVRSSRRKKLLDNNNHIRILSGGFHEY